MPMSSGGHVASSSGCATRPKVREIGLTGCAVPTQRYLLIGSYVMATAEHREPCDSRGSCTVLGAPGGEIPPGDSTKADKATLRGYVRFTPKSGQTGEGSTCPLCAKSGRTRRSKISYSITARSEVERIALKIGASAGRAPSHRQRLRGLSLIQRISSNLNGLCLRHVLSNGKSSRRTLRCSE